MAGVRTNVSQRGRAGVLVALVAVAGLAVPVRADANPTGPPTLASAVAATPPAPPASISSTDYPDDGVPHGGIGLPGTFGVTAPTTRPDEVTEYAYSFDPVLMTSAETVAARPTDHGASITVAPPHDGINVLHVWSKNHLGQFSTPATYSFSVRAGSGPAAEWTFEEAGPTATDVTGHGNDLIVGASASRVPGRAGVGTTLSLPGATAATLAGAINTPHPDTGVPTSVRTDASFTVAAWAKLDSTSGSGVQTVVSASGSRVSAYHLGYAAGAQRWQFTMASADTDDSTLHSVLSDAMPTVGKWTHLAGVYDASSRNLTLYVNGVSQAATASLIGGFNAATEVSVGKRRWNGADDGFFVGATDDVRFYTFVETPANLAELAVPLPPVITFPNGTDATAGGQLAVRFDAGGDTNVTKFRYSVGGTGLGGTVNADTAGGTATVTIDVGSVTGQWPIYAVAVDDGDRVSDMSQGAFTVVPAALLSGTVWNEFFLPQPGVLIELQPGGHQTVSGPDGSYALTGFPPGLYTITASYGSWCGEVFNGPMEIDGQGTVLDIYLFAIAADLGQTCQ
ncbi:LamG-like jellyroll fold domain-containing protein [Solwaraspora sp. WMMB335]|uniref:LamG-like jellyroll fold domain-containing protein n=1 Tax=Solwaraspora sp. WMMB335 TaxID=3404118 RepID=UPI003B92CC3E